MKKLTTLAIFCLCSSLLANEGAVSIDLNSGKDIYSQCLDETIKELKKEDSYLYDLANEIKGEEKYEKLLEIYDYIFKDIVMKNYIKITY